MYGRFFIRFEQSWNYVSPNCLGVVNLDDLVYDFDTQEFKDLSNGANPTRFTDKDFESLARTKEARATNAGSTTLKRAVIAHTFIRAQGEGRKRLLELIGKLKFQRLENTQLKEIFYSRNQSTLPDTITVDGKQRPTLNSNGKPMIVGIKPKLAMQQLNDADVNFQATIFPTTWKDVQGWNKQGLLRYYNEKSPRISVAASNPREAATEVDTQEGFDATIGR